MDTTVIDRKRSDLADVLTQIETLATRDEFKPEDVAELQTRANGLKAQIATLTDAMATRAASAQFDDILTRAERTQEARQAEAAAAGESLGSLFTRSAQFSSYGGYGATGRVETGLMTRALPMTSATFAEHLNATNRPRGDRPLRTPLLDLVGGIPTTVGGFKIPTIEVKGGVNPVVPTAEGVLKPSVEFEEKAVQVNLDTLPVWTQVSRQALEDVPGLRARIDGKLTRLVLEAAEKRVAAAILAATLPTAEGGGSLIAAIRNGVATVQDKGGLPQVVLLNPFDWATIDIDLLTKTLNGAVVNGDMWSIRPIAVPGLTAGTAIVGDIEAGVERYERTSGVSVYITDSHASTFTENVFTILAEARDDTVVVDAQVLVECTAGVATP